MPGLEGLYSEGDTARIAADKELPWTGGDSEPGTWATTSCLPRVHGSKKLELGAELSLKPRHSEREQRCSKKHLNFRAKHLPLTCFVLITRLRLGGEFTSPRGAARLWHHYKGEPMWGDSEQTPLSLEDLWCESEKHLEIPSVMTQEERQTSYL